MHSIRLIAQLRPPAAALVLLLGAMTSPAHAEEDTSTLTPYEATYTASMNKGVSLNGTAKRSLRPKGDGVWLYRTDVDSFIADIDESLVLRWENNQVVPLQYRYRLSGFLIKDREQTIDFDWEAGIATGKYRGKSFELKLTDGALDPLGFQLQLSQDIKTGKRDMTYQVIDGGNYDHDRFAVIDEEPLETSDGPMPTLKAEKVRAEDSKRETLLWFAPDEDFLLVRLRQVEPDGSSYELRLNRADMGG